MASSSFTSFLCWSSTIVSSSSFPSGARESSVSLRSLRAKSPLIEDKLTNNGLRTSCSFPILLHVLGAIRGRRCLAIQTGKLPLFLAALQGDNSSILDEALLGSTRGVESEGDKKERQLGSGICPCRACGRRGLIASLSGLLTSTTNIQTASSASLFEKPDYNAIREAVHPARPTWYEEFYAQSMARTMVSYEAEVADYKRQLFGNLNEKVEHILELGIGTGPNLKYYGSLPHLQRVVGVDPNLQMAKYCAESATVAGLSDSQFEFLNAVGEGIPVEDESMDAVVCTLTLCSVSSVAKTLEEVKRVLRPGGAFLFVEHVVAPEGTSLRFWQGLLDPLQQWFADGCHLTRNTLQQIEAAQFDSVQSGGFTVASASLFGPHIKGIAYKRSRGNTSF